MGKKLNDFHPNDPQINFQLGKVYNKLGNYNLSFGHMTRATKLDPKGTAKQKDCSDSFSMTNDSSTLEGGNFDTTVETSETSYARHQSPYRFYIHFRISVFHSQKIFLA